MNETKELIQELLDKVNLVKQIVSDGHYDFEKNAESLSRANEMMMAAVLMLYRIQVKKEKGISNPYNYIEHRIESAYEVIDRTKSHKTKLRNPKLERVSRNVSVNIKSKEK